MASKILVDELAPYSHATDVTLATGKKIAGADTQFKITGGSNLNILQTDGSGNVTWVAPGASGLFSSYAIIEDQKTSGTNGGTFTSGAWRTRDLNNEIADPDDIVSIAANRFTLLTGSYLIKWFANAKDVDSHISKLYDVTGTADIQFGSSEDTQNTITVDAKSIGAARVTVAASPGTNQYEIQHQCETTDTTQGFGKAAGYSVESYLLVEIYKEA